MKDLDFEELGHHLELARLIEIQQHTDLDLLKKIEFFTDFSDLLVVDKQTQVTNSCIEN